MEHEIKKSSCAERQGGNINSCSHPKLWSKTQSFDQQTDHRVKRRSLRERVRTSITSEVLGVGSLFSTERSQRRWLRHLYHILPGEVPRACPAKVRPWGRTRTSCGDSAVQGMSWNHPEKVGGSVQVEGKERWMHGSEAGLTVVMCLFRRIYKKMNSKSNDWVILIASFQPVLHQPQH